MPTCARGTICPRRLMDRPGGYGPSDARSTRAGDTVTVADLAMQRIVVPPYAGSNPVGHPKNLPIHGMRPCWQVLFYTKNIQFIIPPGSMTWIPHFFSTSACVRFCIRHCPCNMDIP